MSARTVKDEITGASSVLVQCDICSREAPPAAEILAGFGLNRMGWECHGGTHICPDCPHPAAEVRHG